MCFSNEGSLWCQLSRLCLKRLAIIYNVSKMLNTLPCWSCVCVCVCVCVWWRCWWRWLILDSYLNLQSVYIVKCTKKSQFWIVKKYIKGANEDNSHSKIAIEIEIIIGWNLCFLNGNTKLKVKSIGILQSSHHELPKLLWCY
jgi:hypothetical protein